MKVYSAILFACRGTVWPVAGYIPRRLVDRGFKKLILGGLDKFLVMGISAKGTQRSFFFGIIGDDKISALLMPVRTIFAIYPGLSGGFYFFEKFFCPEKLL